MNLKSFILLGSSLPNEYICTSGSLLDGLLHVKLSIDLGEVDVSASHILLGYKPLMIGLPFRDRKLVSWAEEKSMVRLSFRSFTLQNREIAWLELKRVGSWRMGDTTLLLYQGKRGGHEFAHVGYKWINELYEFLRSRKAGNIHLPTRLYTQVRIAYAVPRKISLICLGNGGGYNIFPSDLHGSVGRDYYAGSLRIGSQASGQVEGLRKILVADINVSAYAETYSLGQNHMDKLRSLNAFQTSGLSKRFQLPVPRHTVSYKELLLKDSFDSGIHRIHFYETLGEETIDTNSPRLCHIHRIYAQWAERSAIKSGILSSLASDPS